jgi:hypothetical protein
VQVANAICAGLKTRLGTQSGVLTKGLTGPLELVFQEAIARQSDSWDTVGGSVRIHRQVANEKATSIDTQAASSDERRLGGNQE